MLNPFRSTSLLIVLISSLGAPTASAQDAAAIDTMGEAVATTPESSPQPTVEAWHLGLLEVMKEAKTLGFQGRVDRLAPMMAETFDLDFMASKTVGRLWRKLSEEDKARWEEAFARLTTANYAGRFTGYTGERFVTLGEEQGKRGTRMVLTKIVVPDDDDVQLNYRLRQRDGVWKVIDVYLNGTVSELALRRSEYSAALKREGFEKLVARVETKIADLTTKGLTDG
jgi:phospholipid transport system substrate-binding protein